MNLYTMMEEFEPFLAELLAKSDGIEYIAFYIELGPKPTREQTRLYFQIYTLGLMERSHLACITLLARSHRWMQACRLAVRESNALSFAASLRGLLESAADGFDLMQYLTPTLAAEFERIYAVLNSRVDDFTPIVMAELEDRLIHYAFATRPPKGSSPLPHHIAKPNSDYIRKLEKFGAPRLNALYAELCALTHPSADSVNCFTQETDRSMTFVARKDALVIEKLMSVYEESIRSLITFSLNPALVGLAYLRRLKLDWVAPADSVVSTIGNTAETLKKMDEFLRRRDP